MMNTIDSTLRQLDPADPAADATSERARIDLTRILQSAPEAPSPVVLNHRRPIVRLATASALVAAAGAAVFVVVPSITGGDEAFATWTATPSGMSAAETARSAEQCRDAQREMPAGYEEQLAAARVAISERRGEWTTVVLTGTDGFSALCITDESKPMFESWVGSAGTPTDYVTPQARSIQLTSRGPVAMNGHELSLLEGAVGAEVVGVSYQSKGNGEVQATVSQGRFALWFPGDELKEDGADVVVSYRDGTSATVRAFMQPDMCQPRSMCS